MVRFLIFVAGLLAFSGAPFVVLAAEIWEI